MPVCDPFGLRYTEDAKKDVGNLEWGGVVGSDSGPVQEWTRSEWEAGGMGAYVAALSMLADVVPLSVAWTAVWRFTRESGAGAAPDGGRNPKPASPAWVRSGKPYYPWRRSPATPASKASEQRNLRRL